MSNVKEMLQAGKTVVGTTGTLASPVAFLADSGYDFILFDTQHESVEIKELKASGSGNDRQEIHPDH
jgi:2-keto-3-deoxy-L-rhamnonate aldolase RhmA